MEPTGRTFFRALGVLVRRLIRNVRRCQFDDANPDSLMLTALFVTARIIANPVSNVFQKQLAQRSANPVFIIGATQALLTLVTLPLLFGPVKLALGAEF